MHIRRAADRGGARSRRRRRHHRALRRFRRHARVLVHAFGWSWSDYDKLAQASLAGHLSKFRASNRRLSRWRDVPGWTIWAMPIAECSGDGSFVITKPAGTGGLVSPLSVAEQMLYEIGDPAAYILPDVVCDFRAVTMEEAATIACGFGARGRPPTPR